VVGVGMRCRGTVYGVLSILGCDGDEEGGWCLVKKGKNDLTITG